MIVMNLHNGNDISTLLAALCCIISCQLYCYLSTNLSYCCIFMKFARLINVLNLFTGANGQPSNPLVTGLYNAVLAVHFTVRGVLPVAQ